MIAWVVRGSVRHPLAVLGMLAVALIGTGLLVRRLTFDALPDITNNQVLVLTAAPGLIPEEVERLVTRPVEMALGGAPGLLTQRSLSRYGISSVTAVFADGVPQLQARQLVQERLNALSGTLPPGVEAPALGPITGGLGEIFHFTLNSSRRTPAELYELATLRVAPLLRAVPGVVEVNTWGGQRRALEVRADPLRLSQVGATLGDVRDALVAATGIASGASVPAGSGQSLLRGFALPSSASELSGAALGVHGEGPQLRISDVAQVSPGSLTRIGAATANGRGETVYVMVQMLRGDNALNVVARLHERMPEVREALPEDVRVELVYDRSVLVHHTLRTVAMSLGEGGILVAAMLLLMLGSWRAAVLVAAVIPLSMAGAAAGMAALGVPGNLMSLGAIDFGMIVDGAVVMVEAVFHAAANRHPSRESWAAEVEQDAIEVSRPVFFSVLVILLVFVPVLTLTGVDGKMFRPMALTVVLALLTALVLSITVVPAALARLLGPEDVPRRTPWLPSKLEDLYAPMLRIAVRHPTWVLAGALLLLALGAVLFFTRGTEFTPQLDEGDLVVQTTRRPDISLESSIREAGRLESVLLGVPEVRQVVSRIGSPAVATDIMGLEMADVFVKLAPRSGWRKGLTREALIADMERRLADGAPGGEPAFTQPIQMRFNELLGGAVTDVAVSVYGENLGTLRTLAAAVARAVAGQPGAADVRVLAPPDVSVVEVRPDPLRAAANGLRVRDVLDAVTAVRSGLEVGATYDGALRIPVLLRTGGEATAFDLPALPVPTPGGGLVPLSGVAEVRSTTAPGLVSRNEAQRRLVVGFNVRGADLGRVVTGARARVNAAVKLPEGYRLAWGGQYENLTEAVRRLRLVIPAVLVLILVLLLVAFRELRATLLLFAAVPFACVGGLLALAVRGLPISMSAAIGFIALSGVAVLNGVVLVSRLLANERQGMSPADAARNAAESRVRPVLMTASVAGLGFLPMALASGIGAEVQRPLATVVVGGLVTSTLLTLVVIPALYHFLEQRLARRRA